MLKAARAIRPLSDLLINQIAAGEVIERPASVVKELVENSLDAGAGSITVETVDGGLTSIAVTDDGHGVPPDQIHAALARHCTSKIAVTADLDAIASLGFRGEALASIAAVADVEFVTRTGSDAHAWRVSVAAGREPSAPQACRGPVGTRLVVRDLFHNVPARRRFLKRPRTEFLHVQRLLRRIAFAVPSVAFSLSQAGSRGFSLSAGGAPDSPRWANLLGGAFVRDAVAVAAEADGISVRGWVGGPHLATSHSELQYLALNGRHIRDRQLVHAVRLAFGDRLPTGRFPAYALAIELPPDAVDVNVHPGKLEVRFAAPRAVHDLVYAVVSRALDNGAPGLHTPARGHGIAMPPRAHAGGYESAPRRSGSREVVREAARGAFEMPHALVGDRFLVFGGGEALQVVDLRAAWRRVIAARLAVTEAPATRPLLFPERIPGPPPAADRIAELAAAGAVLDPDGTALRLRAVPAVLPDIAPARFVVALGAALERGATVREALSDAGASAAELGRAGVVSTSMLSALSRAAAGAGVDPACDAFPLDADTLAALAADRALGPGRND